MTIPLVPISLEALCLKTIDWKILKIGNIHVVEFYFFD